MIHTINPRALPSGPVAWTVSTPAVGGCTCGGAPSVATLDVVTIRRTNTPVPTPLHQATRSCAASSRASIGSGAIRRANTSRDRSWRRHNIVLSINLYLDL
jgi:hypothetical protein